jgi:hypothetical protein
MIPATLIASGLALIADTVLMLFSERYVEWWRINVWNRTANVVDEKLFPGKQREYVSRYIASFQFGFLGLFLIAIGICSIVHG